MRRLVNKLLCLNVDRVLGCEIGKISPSNAANNEPLTHEELKAYYVLELSFAHYSTKAAAIQAILVAYRD